VEVAGNAPALLILQCHEANRQTSQLIFRLPPHLNFGFQSCERFGKLGCALLNALL
jgi:hypothetical protein